MSVPSIHNKNNNRNAWLDAIKGAACVAIVWHHLAIYGPMPEAVAQIAPGVMGWLGEYARIAVQIFLVLGGYLAAASLAPDGVARFDAAGTKIAQRAMRLMAPYCVALLFAVLTAALVRPWLDHGAVPGQPSWSQLIANALMLQDITGEDALSAGVWYVAIDFQLYAAAALLLATSKNGLRRYWGLTAAQYLVVGLCALSLWVLNRNADLDCWFVYFMGSYGLGMLAYWGKRSSRPRAWMALLLVLGLLALVIEFRLRIAVALLSAVVLLWLMRVPANGPLGVWLGTHVVPLRWLQSLGRVSYSVFLVHFSVVLLCNALVSYRWPAQPWLSGLGLCAGFALSLLAGHVLYHWVEAKVPSFQGILRWQLGLVGGGLVISLLSARLAM